MAEAAAVIELSVDDRQTQSCLKLTHFEAPRAGFNHPLMSQNAGHVIGSRRTNGEFATQPREAGLDPLARIMPPSHGLHRRGEPNYRGVLRGRRE